jgi:uncharacterized protein YgiB involved in biofilm formation
MLSSALRATMHYTTQHKQSQSLVESRGRTGSFFFLPAASCVITAKLAVSTLWVHLERHQVVYHHFSDCFNDNNTSRRAVCTYTEAHTYTGTTALRGATLNTCRLDHRYISKCETIDQSSDTYCSKQKPTTYSKLPCSQLSMGHWLSCC